MGRGRVGGERGARGSWAGVASVESAGRGVHGPEDGGREDGSRATAVPPHRPCSAAPISWLLSRGTRGPSRCVWHSAACARSTGAPPPASHFSGPRPPCEHRLRPAPGAGSIRAGQSPEYAEARCLAVGPIADGAFAGPEPEAHGRYRGTDRAAPRIRPIRSPERGRRQNALTARSAAACPLSGAQTMSARRTRAAEMGRRRGGPRRARAGSAVHPHSDGPRAPNHNSQLIGAAEHGRWGGTAVARDPSSRPPSSGP